MILSKPVSRSQNEKSKQLSRPILQSKKIVKSRSLSNKTKQTPNLLIQKTNTLKAPQKKNLKFKTSMKSMKQKKNKKRKINRKRKIKKKLSKSPNLRLQIEKSKKNWFNNCKSKSKKTWSSQSKKRPKYFQQIHSPTYP